jgi:hypothetical protein
MNKQKLLAAASFISFVTGLAACESKTGGLWGPLDNAYDKDGGFGIDEDSGGFTNTVDGSANKYDGGDAATLTPAPCSELAGTAAVGSWSTLPIPVTLGAAFDATTVGTVDVATGDVYFVTWTDQERHVLRYRPPMHSLGEIALDANAPSVRHSPTIGIVEGRLYVYGGRSPELLSTGASMDLATQKWASLPLASAPILEIQKTGPATAHAVLASPGVVVFYAGSKNVANPASSMLLDVGGQSWSSGGIAGAFDCDSLSVGPNNTALCMGTASNDLTELQFNDAGVTVAGLGPVQSAYNSSSLWSTFVGSNIFVWNGPNASSNMTGPSQAFRGAIPAVGWTLMRSFLARDKPYVMTVNQKVVIWNGKGPTDRNDGLSYDPAAKTWSPVSCAGGPKSSGAAVSDGTHAYVIGDNGTTLYTLAL